MRHAPLVLIAMVAGLALPSARAATLTWGTSGTGGGGTWSATNAWYDGASQQTWNNANNDDAWFTGTPGTVTLTQAQTANSVTFNSFSGTYSVGTAGQALTINGGGLTMNSGAGAVAISSPVTLGAAQTWTNSSSSLFTVTGSVTNGGNLLTVAGSGSMTFSAAIAGTGGLTKSGAGTLTLNNANTLTGAITVSSGTLLLGNSSAGGAGGIVLGDASTGTNPVAVVSNVGITSPANITVSALGTGSASIGSSGGSSAVSYSGTLTLNRATTLVGLNSDRTSFLSKITGNVGTLTIGGNQRVTLHGATNDFVGDVVVESGGKLQLSTAGAIPDASAVTLNGSGGLYFANNITETIGSLTGGTAAVVSLWSGISGLNTLAVGSNNTSTTFAGSMTNGQGTFALTKIGTGTQTLSGANTYTGTTTISAGTLRIGDSGTTGSLSTSTAITGSAGATLAFQRSDAITVSNTISGAVGVAQLGSGTLTLSGSNTYSGTTSALAGTIVATGTGSLPAFATAGRVVINGGTLAVRTDGSGWTTGQVDTLLANATKTAGSFGIDTTNGDFTLGTAFTNTNLGSLGLAKLGANSLALTATNTYTGATAVSSGTLVVGDGASAGSIGSTSGVSVASGATLAFNRTDDYGGSFTPAISGVGGLRLLGGSLALAGANTYTGATIVSSGTLVVGDGVAAGSIGSTSGVSVASGARLTFNRTDNYGGNFTTAISGSGGVRLQGGSLTLPNSNTYAAGTIISSGTLVLGNATAAGGGTITLGDASTGVANVVLTLGTNADRSGFTNAITVASQGTGSAAIKWIETTANSTSGSGTITLNRAATFDATQFSGGYYLVNHALSGTGAMTLTNSNGTRFLLNGTSSGYTGDITVQSGGILEPRDTLSATTGNNVTVQSGGELRVQFATTSIGGLLGSGTVQSVSGPATLTVGKGDASGTFSGIMRDNGATLSFTKIGTGTQTLSGPNTFTGTTTVAGGVLQIGNGSTAGSIGSTSGVSVAAGAMLAFNRTDSYGGTFNRVVSGSGGIRVLAGKLTFGGSNTYMGPTVVAGGTLAPSAATALGQSALILAGAAPGDGGVLDVTSLGSGLSVANGRTLGGYGTVLGDVTIAGGAIVSPGGSIGPLTNTGTQTWGPAGRYVFEITNANGGGSYAGSRWDLLTVSSLVITATSSNQFIVDLQSLTNPTDQSPGAMSVGNWDPDSSYQWKFLVADTTTFTAANFDTSWFTVSTSTTTFLNATNGSFYVARGGGDGGLGGSTNANELYIVYAAVPEPGTLALGGMGLAVIGWAAARKRRSRA